MENIVPHFNKVCINFKEIEDFEKYEIAVKLIDPNFEYEKTVKKINEIINYTFDNIFSDEGILIEIQDQFSATFSATYIYYEKSERYLNKKDIKQNFGT